MQKLKFIIFVILNPWDVNFECSNRNPSKMTRMRMLQCNWTIESVQFCIILHVVETYAHENYTISEHLSNLWTWKTFSRLKFWLFQPITYAIGPKGWKGIKNLKVYTVKIHFCRIYILGLISKLAPNWLILNVKLPNRTIDIHHEL